MMLLQQTQLLAIVAESGLFPVWVWIASSTCHFPLDMWHPCQFSKHFSFCIHENILCFLFCKVLHFSLQMDGCDVFVRTKPTCSAFSLSSLKCLIIHFSTFCLQFSPKRREPSVLVVFELYSTCIDNSESSCDGLIWWAIKCKVQLIYQVHVKHVISLTYPHRNWNLM